MARKSRQEEIAKQLSGIPEIPKLKYLQVGAYVRISVKDNRTANIKKLSAY